MDKSNRQHPFSIHNLVDFLIFLHVDLLALSLAILFAVFCRLLILPVFFPFFAAVKPPPGIIVNLWWLPLIAILFLAYEDLYSRRLPYWREFEKIITALSLAYLITFTLVYLLRIYDEVSRTAIILSYFTALFTVPSFRYLFRSYLNRFHFWRKRILVVGTGPIGISVAQGILSEPYLGYELIGFIADKHAGKHVKINNHPPLPLLGTIAECREIAAIVKADIVILAVSKKDTAKSIVALANDLYTQVKSLILIPDLVGIPVIGIEADYFFNEQLVSLRIRNNLASRGKLFIKRGFDLIAGSLFLLLSLPVMLFISIAIKLDSKGSILFKQERIGRKGRTFLCNKYRTMHEDAEEKLRNLLETKPSIKKEWESNYKLRNDPRVTRVGNILRATSLDELPQLFNVIRGEMSLIGPRPRPLYELEDLSKTDLFHTGLEVRPGLTGLWQVSGRSDLDFNSRIFLDSWYVRNWSFWLDISILLRTFLVIFRRIGAY